MNETQGFRQDIQGLRALAVSLVVTYHIWPSWLSGGFIGVDVFFVISGYLITKHLLDEATSSGTISLSRFWAKRIRRLLPASYFVLFATLILTIAFLPKTLWNQTLNEIMASALYIENWTLIANSTDYLATENQPSLVQHFWSLSAEEQFYFIWPIFILSIIFFTKRYLPLSHHNNNLPDIATRYIRHGLLFIFFCSLIYSIYMTIFYSKQQAYFSTATRAWEFAIGGLLCFTSPNNTSHLSKNTSKPLPTIFSWIGFVMIIICAITFSSNTSFPGYIALIPTLGTGIIILSQNQTNWSFDSLTRFQPIQLIGGISYSVYLWHWPFIIITPLLLPENTSSITLGLTVISTTILFSWATKLYVEDTFLRNKSFINKPVISFTFALSGVILIYLISMPFKTVHEITAFTTDISSKPYESVDDLKNALTKTLSLEYWPDIDQLPGKHAQAPEWIIDKCNNVNISDSTSIKKCSYGNTDSTRTVAVIGDSWATHFLPAIREAFSPNWKIQVLTLGQCPNSDVAVHMWNKKEEYVTCKTHRKLVLEWIAKHKPDLVIASDSPISTANRLMSGANNKEAILEIKDGLQNSYQKIKKLGVEVIHIESPPRINCFSQITAKPGKCRSNKSTEFQRELSLAKISVARSLGFKVIDTTYWVCTSDLVCPNQIGNNLTKADSGHFTGNFSRMLGKILQNKIPQTH